MGQRNKTTKIIDFKKELFAKAFVANGGIGSRAAATAMLSSPSSAIESQCEAARGALATPQVRERIEALVLSAPGALSATEVVADLAALARNPATPTPEKIRALTVLARIHGLFISKSVSLRGNLPGRDPKQLADTELAALLASAVAQKTEQYQAIVKNLLNFMRILNHHIMVQKYLIILMV
jgi:hypothetical protein